MRYRETGSFESLTTIYTDENPGGCNPSVITNRMGGRRGTMRKTWDVVTPNYHKRRRAGEIIVNPFKSEVTSWFNSINGVVAKANNPWPSTSCYLKQTREGPQLSYMLEQAEKGLFPKPLISQSEIDRVTQLAATKAWAALHGSETQVLVFLAEVHKTFALLRNPFRELYVFLKKVRSDLLKSKSAARTVAEYLAAEWLKYRYGIMPILYDIDGLIKALSKDKVEGLRTARGIETLHAEETLDLIHIHGVETAYQWVTSDEIIVKCGLLTRGKLGTRDFLGATLRQFPSTVWEVIPFSFVADWFVNVQAFIGAFAASGSADILGRYTVTTRTITSSYVVQGTSVPSTIDSTLIRPMSGTETVVSRVKTRTDIVPAPGLARKINLSDWNPDRRVFDALALVLQMFASGRKLPVRI